MKDNIESTKEIKIEIAKEVIKEIKTYWWGIKEELQWGSIIRWALALGAVLIYTDVHNLLSEKIFIYSLGINCLIGIVVLVFILSFIVEYKVWELFKILDVNILDKGILLGVFANSLYLSGTYLFEIGSLYKFSVFAILIISLVRRVYFYFNKQNELDNKKEDINIFDLKDIYDDKFELNGTKRCLLSEKDVEYDLLGRDNIINDLYQVITETRAKEKFVISLEGTWGSGKSTIINNVKKKIKDENKEITIIDNFDPWNYVDRESLFTNMVNAILKKSEYPQAELKMNKTIIKFRKAVFGTRKYTSWLNCLLEDDKNNVEELKEKLNKHLKAKSKRIVFFIDNIERMDSENVILLFKIVGNLLNFDKVIYVLSFDDRKIQEIFNQKEEMKYEYLKKIIQMQIRMPEIDRDKFREVYSKCIDNIRRKLSIASQESDCYELVLNHLDMSKCNMRDLKLVINSVLNVSYNEKNKMLYLADLILIEYIKFQNRELYNEIYEKKIIFIYQDLYAATRTEKEAKDYWPSIYNEKEIADKKVKVLEKILKSEKNKEYVEILSFLFPIVGFYKEKQNYSKIENKDSKSSNRICNGCYFDLYFSKVMKVERQKTVEYLESLIGEVNKDNTIEEVHSNIKKAINELNYLSFFINFRVFFSDIEELKKINKGKRYKFLKLITSIECENKTSINDMIKSQIYFDDIFCKIICLFDEKEFQTYLDNLGEKYNELHRIDHIATKIGSESKRNNNGTKTKSIKIKGVLEKMVETIVINQIDIYNNENYKANNLDVIIKYLKDQNGNLKKYIEIILNRDNIIRFLNDLIIAYEQDDETFYIDKQKLTILTSNDKIHEILNCYTCKGKEEEQILEVYYSSLKNDN